MADQTDGNTPDAPVEVSIEASWGRSDLLDPVFVDSLALQRINDIFYLTFGQIRATAEAGSPARATAEIRPLVRLIVPKESMERIAELLNSTVPPKA